MPLISLLARLRALPYSRSPYPKYVTGGVLTLLWPGLGVLAVLLFGIKAAGGWLALGIMLGMICWALTPVVYGPVLRSPEELKALKYASYGLWLQIVQHTLVRLWGACFTFFGLFKLVTAAPALSKSGLILTVVGVAVMIGGARLSRSISRKAGRS